MVSISKFHLSILEHEKVIVLWNYNGTYLLQHSENFSKIFGTIIITITRIITSLILLKHWIKPGNSCPHLHHVLGHISEKRTATPHFLYSVQVQLLSVRANEKFSNCIWATRWSEKLHIDFFFNEIRNIEHKNDAIIWRQTN